jgi:hypothetical protein
MDPLQLLQRLEKKLLNTLQIGVNTFSSWIPLNSCSGVCKHFGEHVKSMSTVVVGGVTSVPITKSWPVMSASSVYTGSSYTAVGAVTSMVLLVHFIKQLAYTIMLTSLCSMSGVESRAAAQLGKSTDSSVMVVVEEGGNSATGERAASRSTMVVLGWKLPMHEIVEPAAPDWSSFATCTCSCCTRLIEVTSMPTLVHSAPRSSESLSNFASMELSRSVSLLMDSSKLVDRAIFSSLIQPRNRWISLGFDGSKPSLMPV